MTLKETLSAEAAWPEGLQDEVDLEPSAEQEDEVLLQHGDSVLGVRPIKSAPLLCPQL